MSRNDVILVVQWRGRFFVLAPACADTQWNRPFLQQWVREHVVSCMHQRRDRARALLHAHNLQKRLCTEYGVREMRVW